MLVAVLSSGLNTSYPQEQNSKHSVNRTNTRYHLQQSIKVFPIESSLPEVSSGQHSFLNLIMSPEMFWCPLQVVPLADRCPVDFLLDLALQTSRP